MKHRYYCLPLRLDEVMQGRNLPQCSIEESIGQHLHLLITTAFGEIEYDQQFGCIVWEADFDNLTTVSRMRDQIKQSVVAAIKRYEARIENVSADVSIQQELTHDRQGHSQAKKKITLSIKAVVRSTRQPFSFSDSFYSGPLSYE